MDWSVRSGLIERQLKHRMRDLTTMLAFGPSRSDMIDPSGQRESLFLSDGKVEKRLDERSAAAGPQSDGLALTGPELVVTVADLDAAREAIAAGADRIDLAWEQAQERQARWGIDSIRQAIDLAREAKVGVGLKTPRVTTERETAEVRWAFGQLRDAPPDWVLAHNPGIVSVARDHGLDVIADFGLNVLNGHSAGALADMGVGRVTASLEASFDDLAAIGRQSPVPVEMVAYGPLEGMLIEHCVYALVLTQTRSKESCRGPCQHVRLALKDAHGEQRRVMSDQYCRNHILSGSDLCVLADLERVLGCRVAALRIDAQTYEPEQAGRIARLHRRKLDAWAGANVAGRSLCEDDWQVIREVSPNGVGLLALGGSVTQSLSTARTMKANLKPASLEVCP